uniref:Homing endonuclease n=1 Tax=Calliactis parasitica TaxID=6114 RepID=Q0PIA8_CALPA|nr:homing endonuclease [Calliactis parasitica]
MFTTITQVLRSSETAREKSWQWLMGLVESQGCLSVARKSHNTEDLSLSISYSLKNAQVLYYIKGLLGFGHVKLLTMAKYYVVNKELLMNMLPLKCSNNEARLAGLVDGEGVFIVSLKHNPNSPSKKKVSFSLVISQVEELVLGPFLEKLGGDLRKNEKEGTFRWEIREKEDLIRAMRLFKKYSLQTKKRVDFLKWCKVLELTNYKSGLRYSPSHGESFGRETL